MMKIGIFGGSFDPVHLGHIEVAKAVLSAHSLDKIIFVPAHLQPLKMTGPHASGEHRLAMLQLAIKGEPQFEASDIELLRKGHSFSIDTVRHFRNQYGPRAEYFFIIGSDSLRDLPRWHRFDELKSMCRFIVAARPGYSAEIAGEISGLKDISADIKRLAVLTTANPAAATEIRDAFARHAEPANLLNPDVLNYIRENRLYI